MFYNIPLYQISNYILLLSEFSPTNLDSLKNDQDINDISILTNINMKSLIEEDINENIEIINRKKQKNNNKNKSKPKKSKANIKNELNGLKNASLSTKLCNNNNLINTFENKINNSNYNSINNNAKVKVDEGIHALNYKELNNISNLSINNMNNSSNLILNSSNINASVLTNNQNNNISIININNKENKKENKFGDLIINKSLNENNAITIEKIFFRTKDTMLNSIKILIILFSIFTFIFIIYYIYKFVISLLFISNFQNIINDFKALALQYNNIIRYWIHIKQLFILPNSTIYYDFNQTEEYFTGINSKVNYIYKYRIKNYESISILYDYLLGRQSDKNITSLDFCLGHKRCNDIKNSSKFLLSNGIESAINLYAKEISNYYKDFNKIKNTIKNKDDIVNNFMNDKYLILSSNVNHIIIFIQELFFKNFYSDEKSIVNSFYLKIKLLNIIEVCFCALINLFSILFVSNFLTKIIYSLEETSKRINRSIRRMKILKTEGDN